MAGRFPSTQDIDADLQLLEGKVSRIRTYSSADGIEEVPRLAGQYGLTVTAGAWVDKRWSRNETEVKTLIRNARNYSSIDRAIVGNEAILRGDLTVEQLASYLRRVRALTQVPVSTAEPWHVWLRHPELAKEVDYIAIHVLPYWEEIPAQQAVAWVLARYRQVQATFPDKHVVLGEVGWPSRGEQRGEAIASPSNQARFVREFLNMAAREGLDYFVMEAFDQPWKRNIEGYVGRYWGLFSVDRHAKFPMVGTVLNNPRWQFELALATLISFLPMVWFLSRFNHIRSRGRLFFALLLQVSASLMVWTVTVPATWYLGGLETIMWGVLLPAQLALLLVVLVNGFEMTEMIWKPRMTRRFTPLSPPAGRSFPRVSLHLAICNEPPAMVIQTLDSLAALDYPDYEVLVIDNNTADPRLWEPVAEHCRKLGSRFRFFTLGKWPGYKAGALNFALTQTDPQAQFIGLVDSDYLVEPHWLQALMPYFDHPGVGFVQAPQDHRDGHENPFKAMINWEYTGFFKIGMVQRNERNAIIQHGTMTLIRKSALNEVGSWGEWCICEDAELGLRLLHAGYESVYVDYPFGRGLTPDSFAGYKRQRFRWAYGAVQILKRHWRWLLPGKGQALSAGQRYHFVTGWLPWFGDALHLVFSVAGLLWSLAMVLYPSWFGFPLSVFLVPILGLFAFKVVHSLWLYEARVPCSFAQRLGAAVAGMALTHVIARAMLAGVFTSKAPFLRTPKMESKPPVVQGLLMAREEALVLGGLWLAAGGVLATYGSSHEAMLWAVILGVQSVPYGAALASAMVSVVPALKLRRQRRAVLVSQEDWGSAANAVRRD